MASTALTVFKAVPQRIMAFARKTLTMLADRTGFFPISAVHASVTRIETNRGLHANVVMAPIMWMQRTFTEAELVVQRRKQDGIWERVFDHPLEQLIARPNVAYDGDALWKATVLSYAMDGNAFWWKVRDVYGNVVELWYIPHWMIRPIWPLDNSEFITGYQVTMGIQMPFFLLPRDVVHLRFGIDPEFPRLGLSPLKSVMREVETDMEAAEFSASILQNMGVPSLIVSPKDNSSPITIEQLNELRNYLKTAASGQNRGNGIVLGKASDITQLGFDPNKIMLPNLRDISEERVCAILGIPAAVVGFGAGLQTTKVGATMREVVKLAWIQCLIPAQKTMARQVTIQLLSDFVSQTNRYRARFDMTEASSFQEEFDLRVSSVSKLVEKGILRVDRAQQMLGLEVDDTREVYLVPTATPEVDPAADPAVTTAPTDPMQLLPDQSPLPSDTLSPDVVKMLQGIRDRLPAHLMARNGRNGHHSRTHP